MSTQSVMSGMYLSEDTEAALRAAQGEPCRSCQRFVVTQSAIVDDVLRSCSAAGDNDVLGRVLLRLGVCAAELQSVFFSRMMGEPRGAARD